MKIQLTKTQIKLLEAERKAHVAYNKKQDKRIVELTKQFGLSDDEAIWDYIVNGGPCGIEEKNEK